MNGFRHDLAGGNGNMIIDSFQSPDFETGVSGWQVGKDGSAEFNNVTVRGTVESGRFIGTGEGLEFILYSGVPAANNVIASSCSAAAVDSEGNAILAGSVVYDLDVSLQLDPSTASVRTYVNSDVQQGTWSQTGQLTLSPDGSQPAILKPGMLAMQNSGPPGAGEAPAGYGAFYGSPDGGLGGSYGPAALAGTFPASQFDTSTQTNANVTGAHALSAAYTVPGSTLKAGTRLVLEVPYTATMEGNTLELGLSVDGSVSFTVNDTISGTVVGSGIGIKGTVRVIVQVLTAGALGTINAFVDGTVGQAGAQADFSHRGSLTGSALGVSLDTTATHTFRLNSLWGASNAGQTASGYGSEFSYRQP